MKRACTALLLALAVLLSASGCVMRGRGESGVTLQIYGLAGPGSGGGDVIAPTAVDWTEQSALSPQEQAAAAMALLLGSDLPGHISPAPRSTQLLSCSVEGGAAVVDLSGAYAQLSGMDLTVADYCITLTLTQISTIRVVHIPVEGRELPYRGSSVLRSGDALLTSREDAVRTFSARLYFGDGQGGLRGEDRLLTLYEGQSSGAVVLEALLSGSDQGGRTLLPEGFAALSVRTESGICYVNLLGTVEALLPPEPAQQNLLVQSVVRSLRSLEGVTAVQFLVEGELRGALGAVDVSQPLTGAEE